MKNIRHRYIAFEIHGSRQTHYTESSLIQVVIGRLRSATNLPDGFRFRLIEYDPSSSKGIARVAPHTATTWMKEFIMSIEEICDRRVSTSILGTSGTLKTARRRYLKSSQLSGKSNKSDQLDISNERDEPAVPL